MPGLYIRDCIADVAARHPNLVVRFGGHAQAAGLSIASDRLADFTSAMEAVVDSHVTPDLFCDAITTDGPLAIHERTLETARTLEAGGPWGRVFPPPALSGALR